MPSTGSLSVCFASLLVLLSICSIVGVYSQTVLLPARLYANQTNEILLISNFDTKAQLRITQNKHTLHDEYVNFEKDDIISYKFAIGGSALPYKNVDVQVHFEDGTISNQEVEVTPSSGVIFFQSDKPVYRIQESVRFRVLRLDSFMTPVNESVKLTVYNHQRIKFEEVTLQMQPPFYVAEHSFNFPSLSRLGLWMAEVKYGSNFEAKENITFELAQYELPTFNTSVTAPKFIILSHGRTLHVSIDANYIYGKPLKGTVYFKVGEMHGNHQIFQTTNSEYFTGTHTRDIELQTDGNFNSPLYVEAIVRDLETNIVQASRSQPIEVVRSPYVISLDNTIRRYKPELANFIIVEVMDPQGVPMPNVPVKLELVTKDAKRAVITPTSISIDGNKKPITNAQGQYIFTFKLKKVGSLNVHIETVDPNLKSSEQAHADFILEMFNEKEREFVSIVNRKNTTFNAGDRFTSRVDTNYNFRSMYLVVSSKGVLYSYEKITNEMINFKLTNQMVPNVRVLVLAFRDDGSFAADFVRLNVKQSNCGTQVSLASKSRTMPNMKVKLNLEGQTGDIVGIHAVDEAVYVKMRSDPNSAFKQLKRSLILNDVGCGPGSGKNSPYTVANAGFRILSSNAFNEKKLPREFCLKELHRPTSSHRSRHKRSAKETRENQILLFKCCQLGKKKYNRKLNCSQKRDIITRKGFSQECAQMFHKCCIGSDTNQLLSASASFNTDIRKKEHEDLSSSPFKSGSINMHRRLTEVETPENPEDRVIQRTDFRETWLFDMYELDSNRMAVFTKIPHTITSWAVSSFSITKNDGFCAAEGSMRVTTFQPFFIKMSLPSVMVDKEQTEVVVNVYNYNSHPLHTTIVLHRVPGICSNWGKNKMRISENASIAPNSSKRVSFPILPYRRGTFQIKVSAESNEINKPKFIDVVIKNLTIIPPGVERIQMFSFNIDPNNKTKRATKIFNNDLVVDQIIPSSNEHRTHMNLTTKTNDFSIVVPDTVKYVLSASGERYMPVIVSLKDMEKFVQMPYGVGVQNINHMAFNLFTLLYMNNTSTRYTPKTRQKARDYMKKALKQQISFRAEDGSYQMLTSGSGSIQLTAFVAKIFCQSSAFLDDSALDPMLISSALKFLSEQQREAGNWAENDPFGNSYNQSVDMLNTVTLTAYITSSLHQCFDFYSVDRAQELFSHEDFDAMLEKAQSFLRNNTSISRNQDSSDLALMAYALSLGKDQELSKSFIDSALSASIKNADLNQLFWHSSYERYPLETAAYTLMAVLQTSKDMKILLPLVNWLSVQDQFGKFNRTLDGTIGLEAMAKFHLFFQNTLSQNVIELNSNVLFNEKFKKSFHFDKSNADLLQSVEVDYGTENISIITKGFGVGKINLLKIFNEFSPSDTCLFDLNIQSLDYTVTSKVVKSSDVDEDDLFEEITKDFGGEKSQSLRRNRRWSMWKSLRQKFFPTGKPSPTKRSLLIDLENSDTFEENNEMKFPPLPDYKLDNPNIKVLNICTRHLQNTHPGFTVIEVNLLSGYQAVQPDLDHLQNRSVYIKQIETIGSALMFYVSNVPFYRPFCFQFRAYESNKVISRQPALVKVYKFSSKTYSCNRLYWETQRTKKTFALECTGGLCECRTNKECPNSNTHNELFAGHSGSVSQTNVDTAFRLFCEYKKVFIGEVIDAKYGATNQSHSMTLRIESNFEHDPDNADQDDNTPEEVTVRMNSKCQKYIKPIGTRVFVMHNDDREFLLDGDSVLIDGAARPASYLEHIKRERRICEKSSF